MESERERAATPEATPLSRVVPSRAILTELARGFLLVHESQPDRAKAFAKRFLVEFWAPEGTPPPESLGRIAAVRRGYLRALRERPDELRAGNRPR